MKPIILNIGPGGVEENPELAATLAAIPETRLVSLFDNRGPRAAEVGLGTVYYSNPPVLLAQVSENYQLIQTADLVAEVAQSFMPEKERKMILKEYRGTLSLSVFENGSQDEDFALGLRVLNSQDGRVRLTAQPALMRLICQNGAIIKHDLSDPVKLLHLLTNKKNIFEVFPQILEEENAFIQNYNSWKNTRLNPEKVEQLNEKLPKRVAKKLVEDFKVETKADWYDAVTDIASNTLGFNEDLLIAAYQYVQTV